MEYDVLYCVVCDFKSPRNRNGICSICNDKLKKKCLVNMEDYNSWTVFELNESGGVQNIQQLVYGDDLIITTKLLKLRKSGLGESDSITIATTKSTIPFDDMYKVMSAYMIYHKTAFVI